MKRLIASTLALMLLLPSCKKDEGYGSVSLGLGSFGDVVEVTRSAVGDYTKLPPASDFILSILNSSSSEVWSGKLSEFPESMTFKAGNYSVSATWGNEGEEGFDKPMFSGEQSFAVSGGKTTEVSVPVSLANCLVKFSCTESFRNYFPEYAFSLTTGSGTVIPFAVGESRAAFVEAYKFTVNASMKSQTGETKTFTKEYPSLSPATCYTVNFDVTNSGGFKLTVTFDDSMETVDLGDVELNN